MKTSSRSFFLMGCWTMSATLGLGEEAKKRNVRFLVTHDMRPEFGCYGNKQIQTPNSEYRRCRQGGVRFERACCQFPRCCRSRSSLLTGLRAPNGKGRVASRDYFA